MFWHVTWRGRASWIYYWCRALFVAPADTPGRCCMGSTVDERVWCPRRAEVGELWCKHHDTHVF